MMRGHAVWMRAAGLCCVVAVMVGMAGCGSKPAAAPAKDDAAAQAGAPAQSDDDATDDDATDDSGSSGDKLKECSADKVRFEVQDLEEAGGGLVASGFVNAADYDDSGYECVLDRPDVHLSLQNAFNYIGYQPGYVLAEKDMDYSQNPLHLDLGPTEFSITFTSEECKMSPQEYEYGVFTDAVPLKMVVTYGG